MRHHTYPCDCDCTRTRERQGDIQREIHTERERAAIVSKEASLPLSQKCKKSLDYRDWHAFPLPSESTRLSFCHLLYGLEEVDYDDVNICV